MQFDQIDLSVCVVCIFLLANGEYNDGTDAAEVAAAGMERIWGADARHLVPGGEELGYSTSSCDACGDWLHGDRFAASALIPVPDAAVVDSHADCSRGFCAMRNPECVAEGLAECFADGHTHD